MWCEKHDHEEKIWEDESAAVLKRVFKNTVKKLERAGIKIVRDIKDLDNFEDTLRGVCHEACNNDGTNGLTVSFF
eukprot:10691002-Ditylum_brightwellii.AAC.1